MYKYTATTQKQWQVAGQNLFYHDTWSFYENWRALQSKPLVKKNEKIFKEI